jgi:hypothetical protein
MDLKKIFGEFAGREIETIRAESKVFNGGGYTWRAQKHNPDPTLSQIYDTAATNQINLRILTPAEVASWDYDSDRLNMRVVEKDDGRWVVSDKFEWG